MYCYHFEMLLCKEGIDGLRGAHHGLTEDGELTLDVRGAGGPCLSHLVVRSILGESMHWEVRC